MRMRVTCLRSCKKPDASHVVSQHGWWFTCVQWPNAVERLFSNIQQYCGGAAKPWKTCWNLLETRNMKLGIQNFHLWNLWRLVLLLDCYFPWQHVSWFTFIKRIYIRSRPPIATVDGLLSVQGHSEVDGPMIGPQVSSYDPTTQGSSTFWRWMGLAANSTTKRAQNLWDANVRARCIWAKWANLYVWVYYWRVILGIT